MEIKIWPTNESEEYCRRWIFNLEQGGVCTYFEELLVEIDANVVINEFKEIDGVAMPFLSKKSVFNRTTREWNRQENFHFFDIERKAIWEEDEFSIAALPINPKIPVNDKRTGRNQLRMLDEVLSSTEK